MSNYPYPCCLVKCKKCKEPSCECRCDMGERSLPVFIVNSEYHCSYGTAYDHERGRPIYLPKHPGSNYA